MIKSYLGRFWPFEGAGGRQNGAYAVILSAYCFEMNYLAVFTVLVLSLQ